jgi:hypothetical protein
MTTQELIALLSQYPPETRVVVPGYEAGYNDINEVREVNIALDVHDQWWYGAHDDAQSPAGKSLSVDRRPTHAFVLAGKNPHADES